jgi:hypothetical protein
MTKHLFIAVVFILTSVNLLKAQDEVPEKRFNHYIGVQANPLLRQILSIGNTPNISNPYLINYSLNSTKSGWGFHVGFGVDYSMILDNDGISDRKSEITNISSRIGFDKVYSISERWQAGFGVDGIFQTADNLTTSQIISFDTVTTVSKTGVLRFGGGLRGFLRYSISKRILLGTESTIYFNTGNSNISTTITRREFNFPGAPIITTSSSSKQDLRAITTTIPVAIYLILKF